MEVVFGGQRGASESRAGGAGARGGGSEDCGRQRSCHKRGLTAVLVFCVRACVLCEAVSVKKFKQLRSRVVQSENGCKQFFDWLLGLRDQV